jgi:hypothetical protein
MPGCCNDNHAVSVSSPHKIQVTPECEESGSRQQAGGAGKYFCPSWLEKGCSALICLAVAMIIKLSASLLFIKHETREKGEWKYRV